MEPAPCVGRFLVLLAFALRANVRPKGGFPSAGSDVAKGKRAKGRVREQWAPRGPRRARTVAKSRRKCADRSDNYENPRTLRLQCFSICLEGYISVEKVWKNVFPNGKNQGIVHTSFLWCFRSLPSAVRQVNVCIGRKGAKVLYCGKVCIGRKGAEEPAAIRCFPLRVRAPVPPVGCPRARCREGARACCGARACARCGARARLPPGRSGIFIN